MENGYRPTRLDHFPKAEDVAKWLKERGIAHGDDPASQQEAMERATGVNTDVRAVVRRLTN